MFHVQKQQRLINKLHSFNEVCCLCASNRTCLTVDELYVVSEDDDDDDDDDDVDDELYIVSDDDDDDDDVVDELYMVSDDDDDDSTEMLMMFTDAAVDVQQVIAKVKKAQVSSSHTHRHTHTHTHL